MQALFRPVSMCVPDLNLICEIMLMAEGFQMSKLLSRKFVILYKLCEDLLSKSKHYDWKLRAIKTTLYVAGGMKRAAPELSEDKVNDNQLIAEWVEPGCTAVVAFSCPGTLIYSLRAEEASRLSPRPAARQWSSTLQFQASGMVS